FPSCADWNSKVGRGPSEGDSPLSISAATSGEVASTVDAAANKIERTHETASRRFNRDGCITAVDFSCWLQTKTWALFHLKALFGLYHLRVAGDNAGKRESVAVPSRSDLAFDAFIPFIFADLPAGMPVVHQVAVGAY